MVGAACAYYCAAAGLRVGVVERGAVASGTTSAGEGNILVSDKEPGPELDLALLSVRLWAELGERLGATGSSCRPRAGWWSPGAAEAAAGLAALVARQRACGVDVTDVDAAELAELEPHLTRDVAGGAYYPQDMQVQPMLAAAELLRLPASSARPSTPERPWSGFRRDGGRRGHRCADERGGAVRALGGQRGRHLGRRGRRAGRRAGAGAAAARVHPRDRAAAAGGPAQGLLRRLRGQRGERRRRAGDLGGRRGHPAPAPS